jgi:DNA-binding transcriptional MocR family regulator
MDERFVAVFPSLVRLLGNMESAAILQYLHWKADEDGDIKVPMAEISDDTGIALRTVERRVRGLRDEGWVEAGRSGAYDATLTYRIDHEKLDTANVADSSSPSRQSGGLDPANLADSDPAKVADSSLQNVRTLQPSWVDVGEGDDQ